MNSYYDTLPSPEVTAESPIWDSIPAMVDRDEVARALRLFLPEGQVTEVRVLGAVDQSHHKPHVMSGFFDDPSRLLEELSRVEQAYGIYFVPNPVNPDLLTRRWLLIDLDPVRPSGVSATDAEHEQARVLMVKIAHTLGDDHGWPEPVMADSGNGYHLMFRIDLAAEDFGLVKHVLGSLAFRFSDAAVQVDVTPSNPARIWKLYGTKAGKGDDTPERPHRMAHLLAVPHEQTIVTPAQLKQVAEWLPAEVNTDAHDPRHGYQTGQTSFSLDDWIAQHDLDVDGPRDWNGGRKWVFPTCPWNAAHTNRSAYIVQFPNGAIGAGCHHLGCVGKDWHALRDLIEPNSQERSTPIIMRPDFQPTDDERAADAAWEPLASFTEFTLPAFPVDALPDWLRDFVQAEAEATQTPPELAGLLVLAACATAVARTVEVVIRPGWSEPLNLYALVVQPPGTRKSAVFRDVMNPIEEVEFERARALIPEIERARSEQRILSERLQRAEREAAQVPPEEREAKIAEARELATQLAAYIVPVSPRLVADDASPEKLQSLLAEQGGRIALLSAEGDVFELMGGRYSANGQPNLGVYLKAHSGDTIIVDRVNRPTEHIAHPALTIALTIQPHVLTSLMDKPAFRGRGLHARFLYALPHDLLGSRAVSPDPMPVQIRERFERHLRALLDLEPSATTGGRPCPHRLHLYPGALMRLETFLGWLEPQLGEFGALRGMADWASKLAGAIARIASLLHLAAQADKPEPWSDFVGPATMEQAIELGMYLLAHAQAAYAEMAADPLVHDARYLLRWIERNGGCAFTKRDAFEGTKGRFERVPQLEPVLALLQQHGYIRVCTTPAQPGPGRKRSPIYEVNPLWDSHNTHNTHNTHNAECDLDPLWLGEETTPLDNPARFNLVSIA